MLLPENYLKIKHLTRNETPVQNSCIVIVWIYLLHLRIITFFLAFNTFGIMITTIHEHSVDLDLLPPNARILDAGCRDMGFTNALRAMGHHVCAIDIDYLPEGTDYIRVGLGVVNGKGYISNDKDPQARRLISPREFGNASPIVAQNECLVLTLDALEKGDGGKFDLIKLDIEGMETDILEKAQHPIAKQVSVEFHAHLGETERYLDLLLVMLSEFYTIHNAVWEKRHGCSENYWDILLIAK